MRGAGLEKHLGGRRPDDHEPVRTGRALELSDVLAQLLGELALRLSALDVAALEPLDVLLVERRRQGLNALQKGRDRLEVLAFEHPRLDGGGVGVVRDRVPRGEHQVAQLGQRDELADLRRALLRPLAQPDRPHLRERPDRESATTAHVLHARDERGGNGAQPDEHDAKFALRGGDLPAELLCHDQCPFRDCHAGACPGSVSRERAGRTTLGPAALRASCTTRCTTVTTVASASTATIQNNNAPLFPAPKKTVGAPRSRTRAARPSSMSNTPLSSSRNPPECARPAANAKADAITSRVPTVVIVLGRTCMRTRSWTSGPRSCRTPRRTTWGIRFIAGGK